MSMRQTWRAVVGDDEELVISARVTEHYSNTALSGVYTQCGRFS